MQDLSVFNWAPLITYECATKVMEDMLEEGATLRDMLKESGQSADGAVVCKLDNDPTLFGYILRYLQGDCGKDFLEHLSVAGLKRLFFNSGPHSSCFPTGA